MIRTRCPHCKAKLEQGQRIHADGQTNAKDKHENH